MKLAILAIQIVHWAVLGLIVAAFFYLPFSGQPWYVWLPLCTFIANLASNTWRCPLTLAENWFRIRAGLPPIERGFIRYYLFRKK